MGPRLLESIIHVNRLLRPIMYFPVQYNKHSNREPHQSIILSKQPLCLDYILVIMLLNLVSQTDMFYITFIFVHS